MTRPCSGIGRVRKAVHNWDIASATGERPTLGCDIWRNTAAGASIAPCASAPCTKRPTSSTQVASRTTPGRRYRTQDARALAVASRSRAPSGPCESMISQPAISATSRVPSRDPPSATMTSRTVPAAAPATRVARVGTSARSQSSVAMMTLSIRISLGRSCCTAQCNRKHNCPIKIPFPEKGRHVLVLFTRSDYVPGMSSSSTMRRTPPPRPATTEQSGAAAEVQVARERRPGRGAQSNASGRYEPQAHEAFDDGWQSLEELPVFETSVEIDASRKVITRNDSPDISFDRSINPYRGCEHGCIYCFARPTHAYLGLSPGLDFESKLFMKPDAPEVLERELSAQRYQPRTIAIGTNTDPYQPIERRYQIMRRILEVLERARHPVGIVTKSNLILRDLDVLSRLAERNLVKVALSVTTLDTKLARVMEPRAPT